MFSTETTSLNLLLEEALKKCFTLCPQPSRNPPQLLLLLISETSQTSKFKASDKNNNTLLFRSLIVKFNELECDTVSRLQRR